MRGWQRKSAARWLVCAPRISVQRPISCVAAAGLPRRRRFLHARRDQPPTLRGCYKPRVLSYSTPREHAQASPRRRKATRRRVRDPRCGGRATATRRSKEAHNLSSLPYPTSALRKRVPVRDVHPALSRRVGVTGVRQLTLRTRCPAAPSPSSCCSSLSRRPRTASSSSRGARRCSLLAARARCGCSRTTTPR